MRPASPTVALEPHDPNSKPQLHQQPDDESSASANHSITHDRQLLLDTPITQTLVSPAAHPPSASTSASASTFPSSDILEHSSHGDSVDHGPQVHAVLRSSFPAGHAESAHHPEHALGDETEDMDIDMDMDMSDSDGGAPLDDFPPGSASMASEAPWASLYPDEGPQPGPVLTNGHGENNVNTSPVTPAGPADTQSSSEIPDSQSVAFGNTSVFPEVPQEEYALETLVEYPPQQTVQIINDDEEEDNNLIFSNPNPIILGSENLGLINLLRNWAYQSNPMAVTGVPDIRGVSEQAMAPVSETRYSDLRGDVCDIQGINWTRIGVTRRQARQRRRLT